MSRLTSEPCSLVRQTRPGRSWLAGSILAFNLAAATGCAALVVLAPSREGALLAAAGLAFFGLAAAAFAMMLRLRAVSSLSRDKSA